MQRVLSVIAVVDSPTPAGWVHLLLEKLETRATIRLGIIVQEPDAQADSAVSPTTGGPSIFDRLLHRRIDKPRFTQDPWVAEPLQASFTTALIPSADRHQRLTDCDVLLKLTTSTLPESLWPPSPTPVWDAHLDTLDARVEDALLRRAPLCWTHLWSHTVRPDDDQTTPGATPESPNTRRIASHALPRQSYSLTDLRRAAWFSLPSLFDSRLNWLAHAADPVNVEYTASMPLAGQIIDPEVRAAHADADQLQQQGFQPTRPSSIRRLGRLLALLYQHTVECIRYRVWYEQWQLAFRNDGPDELFHDADRQTHSEPLQHSPRLDVLVNGKISDFLTIDSPDRTWWADPHLYKHGDELYVFFEEMSVGADHAHLAVARLSDNGRVDEVTTVMDEGRHLSYPFVFADGGEVYMIPETAEAMSVQLFRASQFPQQWEKVTDLLSNTDLADSTVHFDGQRWWMFSNSMSHRSINERDELHLFHADALMGPWQAHPMNPIVTGVDRSRMAGSIIRDGNSLYRPSQFGAKRYGHGINLHRIDTMDLHGYSETIVGRLLPDAGSRWLGCHSTSHLEGVTVIDRVIRRRR